MKQIIFITIVLFLFSSCNTKKNDLYIEYIKRFDEMIQFQEKQNHQILNSLDHYMNDLIYGNPRKIKPWYDRATDVNSKTESLIEYIEEIKLEICETDSFCIKSLNKIQKQNFKIPTKEIEELIKKTLQLKNDLDSVIQNMHNKGLYSQRIRKLINPESWFKINGLNGNHCNSIELIAVLSRIQLDIKTAGNQILNYILFQIDTDHRYSFVVLDAFVEPETKEVAFGNEFNAEIFLGAIDTTYNPIITVNSKKITFIKYLQIRDIFLFNIFQQFYYANVSVSICKISLYRNIKSFITCNIFF